MGKDISRCILAAIAGGILAFGCGGGDSKDLRPVVFMHGCPPPPLTTEQDAGLWTGETQNMPGFTDFFMERGYSEDFLNVFLYDGPTCPPNRDYADQISDYIDGVVAATGQDQVDLVTFSMGGVAARVYVREHGGAKVRRIASISPPNHGSVLAQMVGEAGQMQFGYPAYEGALEVAPEYACQGESTDADIQFFLNGCLTDTGRSADEDETPEGSTDPDGHIDYLVVYNTKDDLVIPQESACLNQGKQNDCSDPLNVAFSIEAMTEILPGMESSHVETELSTEVRQKVFDFLAN